MEILNIVYDIIKKQLRLNNNQIWLYNQKVDIPNDKNMYVVISNEDEELFGVNNEMISHETSLESSTWINVRTTISINTFSASMLALERKYDIIGVMSSVYSLRKQEEHSIQIARIPKVFMDASYSTPTQRLYSYHYEYYIMHVKKVLSKDVEFFDDFSNADMSNKDNIKIN